jgi:outer membrane receptor protein involved in Fe transport
VLFDSILGASVRRDDIDNGLAYTQARRRLAAVVDDAILETGAGVFVREEIQPLRWLRVMGGLRADLFTFEVRDRLEELAAGRSNSGIRGTSLVSPKASVVISPLRELDLFGNLGYGFHSNDARGVVRRVDAVTPLTRAIGYEAGARTRLSGDKIELAAALWGLDLDSELVWVGDEGRTEAAGATRRLGVELEARAELLPWLLLDTDATFSRARFRDGAAVPLAPRITLAGGLGAQHVSGLRGGVRFQWIAERPATEDEFLRAEATTLVDLHAAYRWRSIELSVVVENALDRRHKAAQFATVTRLPGEATCPAGTRAATGEDGSFAGCEDMSFSPGNSVNVRLSAAYYF